MYRDTTTYENMPEGYHPHAYGHKDASKIIVVLVNRYLEGMNDLNITPDKSDYAYVQRHHVEIAIEQALIQEWKTEPHTTTENCQSAMNRILKRHKDRLLSIGEIDVDRRGPEWEVFYPEGTGEYQTWGSKREITRTVRVAFKTTKATKWDTYNRIVAKFAEEHDADLIRFVTVRFPRQHQGRMPKLLNP